MTTSTHNQLKTNLTFDHEINTAIITYTAVYVRQLTDCRGECKDDISERIH